MKDFFARMKGYFADVKGEARKITWPEKQELYDSTIVVIVFIFILALTTLVCDKTVELLIRLVHA